MQQKVLGDDVMVMNTANVCGVLCVTLNFCLPACLSNHKFGCFLRSTENSRNTESLGIVEMMKMLGKLRMAGTARCTVADLAYFGTLNFTLGIKPSNYWVLQ